MARKLLVALWKYVTLASSSKGRDEEP